MAGRHRETRKLPQETPRRWWETDARWRSRALRTYARSLLDDRIPSIRYNRAWVFRNRVAFVAGLILAVGSVASITLFDVSGGRSLYLRIAVGTVGGLLGSLVYLMRRYRPPVASPPDDPTPPSPGRRERSGDVEGQSRS